MNIQKKRFLFIAQYAAPYEGNFIPSLKTLEEHLVREYACSVAYVFPEAAKKQKWIDKFASEHKTFFTRNDVRHSYEELEKIRETFRPEVVHTHFDGYDVVATRVFGKCCCNTEQDCCRVVWHMHNHISYLSHPLKALYQMWAFLRHYGLRSRGVSIISVSEEMKNFALKWQRMALRRPGLVRHIPNGIDLSRVSNKCVTSLLSVTGGGGKFLAFGGRNVPKRIDILMEAGRELAKKRNDFTVYITKGTDTEAVANDFFAGKLPEWLILKEQTQDIASLFNQVDYFVSTSVHETFSYAICEASVFGLPVIQSDIPGTMWNAHNPSTRLFRVNDAKDLCHQMNALMDADKTELEKQVQITIKNNLRDYSLEQWAQKVTDFYLQM